MEIKRFYIDTADIIGDNVSIVGDEASHITSVLRYKVGYKIIVSNNSDNIDYYCDITSIIRDRVTAVVTQRVANNANLSKNIRLLMALPKGDKADFVVQKAVELGVCEIVFFCSSYVNETKYNRDRLIKIAREAAKQCGGACYPSVLELMNYSDVISSYLVEGNLTCMFYERELVRTLNDIESELVAYDNINIMIGSEGGFSDEEHAAAIASSAVSISLGNRIMRCETAAVAATALVCHLSGATKR